MTQHNNFIKAGLGVPIVILSGFCLASKYIWYIQTLLYLVSLFPGTYLVIGPALVADRLETNPNIVQLSEHADKDKYFNRTVIGYFILMFSAFLLAYS